MKFATITNNGMVDFCINAITSLRSCGINDTVYVGCTDEKSKEKLIDVENIETHVLSYMDCPEEHENWSSKGFRQITQNKFPFILSLLDEAILYFDNDVVFKQNPQKDIDSIPEEIDIVVQSDLPTSHFCTGFIYIRPTDKSKNIIKKTIDVNFTEQKKGNLNIGDQLSFIRVVSENSENIVIATFPSSTYPNGHVIMNNKYDVNNFKIAHANYVIGKEEKKKLLESINGWLI